MLFNRFESYRQAIQDRSMDFNLLSLMIDFHKTKGTMTTEESTELFEMMYPPEEVVEEEPIV